MKKPVEICFSNSTQYNIVIMENPKMNASQVAEIALAFMKKTYFFIQIRKVIFDKNKCCWEVEVDVGLYTERLYRIIVADSDGTVLSLEPLASPAHG